MMGSLEAFGVHGASRINRALGLTGSVSDFFLRGGGGPRALGRMGLVFRVSHFLNFKMLKALQGFMGSWPGVRVCQAFAGSHMDAT